MFYQTRLALATTLISQTLAQQVTPPTTTAAPPSGPVLRTSVAATVNITSDKLPAKLTYWTTYLENPDTKAKTDFRFNVKCELGSQTQFKLNDWNNHELKCFVGLKGAKWDVCQASVIVQDTEKGTNFFSRDLSANRDDWWTNTDDESRLKWDGPSNAQNC